MYRDRTRSPFSIISSRRSSADIMKSQAVEKNGEYNKVVSCHKFIKQMRAVHFKMYQEQDIIWSPR